MNIHENTLMENENKYEKKELLELIISSLDFLEKKYRVAFIMREFEGLSYREIADKTNITQENAKVRALREKKKISEVLQPYIKDIKKFEK
jgi:RNA polymerase sigma-70 factor (ECF subfamily)